MREYVIEQLRRNASVRGKQRTWISELTDEQIYQLFQRLRSGENAKSIARYIQKAWNVLPNSSAHSVSQGVLKFRRRIAHLLLSPPAESVTSTAENIGQLENLEAMEHIAQLQLERIQLMMREETETGIRYGTLSREIHALTSLNKAITKAKEWEMLHEGADPLKRRRFERMRQKMDTQFHALMDQISNKNAVVEAAQRFLEMAEERSVIMNIGSDGKYHVVKPGEDSQEG